MLDSKAPARTSEALSRALRLFVVMNVIFIPLLENINYFDKIYARKQDGKNKGIHSKARIPAK